MILIRKLSVKSEFLSQFTVHAKTKYKISELPPVVLTSLTTARTSTSTTSTLTSTTTTTTVTEKTNQVVVYRTYHVPPQGKQ